MVALAAWYAGAVICEQFDGEIYALLGETVSGHSIKHLLAAGAIAMVALMLRRAAVAGERRKMAQKSEGGER